MDADTLIGECESHRTLTTGLTSPTVVLHTNQVGTGLASIQISNGIKAQENSYDPSESRATKFQKGNLVPRSNTNDWSETYFSRNIYSTANYLYQAFLIRMKPMQMNCSISDNNLQSA